MSKDYRVNTFGLTDEENTLVEESLPTRAYELYIADTPTDMIAIGCDAMNFSAFPPQYRHRKPSQKCNIVYRQLLHSKQVPLNGV